MNFKPIIDYGLQGWLHLMNDISFALFTTKSLFDFCVYRCSELKFETL